VRLRLLFGPEVSKPPFNAPKLVCLLLFVELLGSACGSVHRTTTGSSPVEMGFPVTIEAANSKVTLRRRPARIVSLSPTGTEILFTIGAGTQVVAVDENSNHPPRAPRTPLSGLNPNIEALATYEPDLVIYSAESGNLGTSLQTIGIPAILQPAARHLSDTFAQILELGAATGHRDQAGEVVRKMKAEIKEIVESRPRLDRSLTYYHELDETYFTATSNTFIGEIYGLLGLRNIADQADKDGSGYPQLSGEYIIKANPDLIFLANAKCCGQSARTVAARPGWLQIKAVQGAGTIELDDDIASRWGPRTVDFLRSVAAALESLEPAQR
jgi:iron complex transport system substrate-binding protein